MKKKYYDEILIVTFIISAISLVIMETLGHIEIVRKVNITEYISEKQIVLTDFVGCIFLASATLLMFAFITIFQKRSDQKRRMTYLAILSAFTTIWQMSFCGRTAIYGNGLFFSYEIGFCAHVLSVMTMALFLVTLFGDDDADRRSEDILYLIYAALGLLIPLFAAARLFAPQHINAPFFAAHILAPAAAAVMVFISFKPTRFVSNRRILTVTMCLYFLINIIETACCIDESSLNMAAPLSTWCLFLCVSAVWIMRFKIMYVGIQESNEIRAKLMESQMQLMLSQIKPHFIYNALNSINILIRKDPEVACNMVTHFSTYLRNNMDAMGDKQIVTFRQELEHIKAYVEIEKVRFPRIEVNFEIDEADFNIPVLTVEPLVENAIKHGVAKARHGGMVIIRAYRSGRNIYIEVIDNGVGFNMEDVDFENGPSLGIKNVKYRLEEIMKGELSIRSRKGKGTTATIRVSAEIAKGKV